MNGFHLRPPPPSACWPQAAGQAKAAKAAAGKAKKQEKAAKRHNDFYASLAKEGIDFQ